MKTIMIRGIDDHTHRDFKKMCVEKDTSMNDALKGMIEKALRICGIDAECHPECESTRRIMDDILRVEKGDSNE